MIFILTIVTCVHSAENNEGNDPELKGVLETLKSKRPYLINKRFPNLPTERDIEHLEAVLFNGSGKLPISLKEYHLTLGNLVFSVRFPPIHFIENEEENRSHFLYFIREGHSKGISLYWIPFCEDGEYYVCMELGTQKVCYFSFIPRFEKEKTEYENLSSWIKERLLPK